MRELLTWRTRWGREQGKPKAKERAKGGLKCIMNNLRFLEREINPKRHVFRINIEAMRMLIDKQNIVFATPFITTPR